MHGILKWRKYFEILCDCLLNYIKTRETRTEISNFLIYLFIILISNAKHQFYREILTNVIIKTTAVSGIKYPLCGSFRGLRNSQIKTFNFVVANFVCTRHFYILFCQKKK